MNNEDKIIQILTGLQGDMKSMQGDIGELKQGQAKLVNDVSDLKQGQVDLTSWFGSLDKKISKLDEKVSKIDNVVINIEKVQADKFGALFDQGETLSNDIQIIKKDITDLKSRSEEHDLVIIAAKHGRVDL